MGIGIRNNSSGARVTINGEKLNKKINFTERLYETHNRITEFDTLGESDVIAVLNDTVFAHTGYYSTGYGFDFLIISEYDKNTGKITDRRIEQNSNYIGIASGYNDNMYQITQGNKGVNSVREYKLDTSVEDSENIFTETKLLEISKNLRTLVQVDTDTLYLYSPNTNMEIIKFGKKNGDTTAILSATNDFDVNARTYLFCYKDKLYLIASEKTEVSKWQNIYEINLQKNTITKLFNIADSFNTTPTNVASRLDRKKGKLIFYFMETYALKQAEWDIESNKFSEVVTLYEDDKYIQLLEIAVEETDYFKVCLTTEGVDLHKRIYSKVYTKEEF